MKIYTTGQAAKITQVTPKTITKWFDQGLLQGYKLPNSQDRRIPEPNLIKFMQKQGYPQTMIPNSNGNQPTPTTDNRTNTAPPNPYHPKWQNTQTTPTPVHTKWAETPANQALTNHPHH